MSEIGAGVPSPAGCEFYPERAAEAKEITRERVPERAPALADAFAGPWPPFAEKGEAFPDRSPIFGPWKRA